jgi:rod shape-determining protein MreC
MTAKHAKISKGVVFTWLVLGGIICLLLPTGVAGRMHLGFLGLYNLIPSGGRTIALASTTNDSSPSIPSDSRQLQQQNDQLQNQLSNVWAELAVEHGKVEQLSEIRTRFPALKETGIVLADVIAAQAGSKNELVINRGSSDGVQKDQFVMSAKAIVGRVTQVTSGTAVIRPVSDKGSSIAVEVAGSKLARMMKGDSKGLGRIHMVPRKYHIEKNAVVYACKVPGLLDTPIIVGHVARVKPDDDNPLLWDIQVEPAVKLDSLANVEVLVNR